MINTIAAAKISPNNATSFFVKAIGEDWMETRLLIMDRE